MNDFEQLYRRHASALLRFAWGLSGSRAVAEDLVQETFVRILVRAPRFETRSALAYLLAVVRNTYLKGRRHADREAPLTEDLPASSTDLDLQIDDRDRLAAVTAALAELPEGERSALLLRVDHELPYDEIAATLGISLSAAKVRVHRARLRLAQLCREDEGVTHD